MQLREVAEDREKEMEENFFEEETVEINAQIKRAKTKQKRKELVELNANDEKEQFNFCSHLFRVRQLITINMAAILSYTI